MSLLKQLLANKPPIPPTVPTVEGAPDGEVFLLILVSEIAAVRVNHRKPGICHNEVILKGGAHIPLNVTETALLAQKLEQAHGQPGNGNPEDGPPDPARGEVLVKLPL